MPVCIIGAAVGGGAGIAASQLLALTAFRAGLPATLIEVEAEKPDGGPRARLFPPRMVPAQEVPALLEQGAPQALAIVTAAATTSDLLQPLLSQADVIVIPGMRFGDDLERAYALYRTIETLQVRIRRGGRPEPWLLPAGWSCSRAPEIRLHGWRKRLAQVAGNGKQDLRCLPLVLPWNEPGSLKLANPARVGLIGQRLLEHLASIAAGRQPTRPADGMAGGDPWPDSPVYVDLPSMRRLPGTLMRLAHTVAP